jgi:ABC-type cobalamin/Fe3+-siderophores transport system ATPase subunit
VEEIVGMGRLGRCGLLSRSGPEDDRHISESLRETGISSLRRRLYRELSGGQKQRVLLARALACQPDVLLLDEPTNDMDIQGEEQIMTLLREVQQGRRLTVVLVSHLLHVVLNFTERIAFLSDGAARVHSIDEIASGDLLSRIYRTPVTVGESRGKKYLVTGSR